MVEFKKMTKAFGRYYLVTGILAILFVITRAVYVCRSEEIAFMGTSVKKILQVGGTVGYHDVCDAITERLAGVEFIGSFLCIIVLGAFSCGRYLWVNSRSSAEFLKGLPVREWVVVLFDYLAVAGMIVVSGLVETLIYLFSQTHFYQMTSGVNQTGEIYSREFVTAVNAMVLKEMIIYVGFILFMFTSLYLGITIVKNSWLGMGIALFLWYIILNEDVGYDVWSLMQTKFAKNCMETLFYPYDLFEDMQNGSITFSTICLVLLAATAVLLLFILLAGKYREQTNGRLFYFPVLDLPFAAVVGCIVMYCIKENIYDLSAGVVLFVGFVTVFFIFILIHPFSGSSRNQWEVK